MDSLSDDLLNLILSFRAPEETLFLALVCKRWNFLVKKEPIEKIQVLNYHAFNGHISALRLLKQFGNIDFHQEIYSAVPGYAAYGGRIETLKWLREQNCIWDDFLFEFAFLSENLEVLQYLYDNCPYSASTIESAIRYGNKQVLTWLKDKGFSFTTTCWNIAVESENAEALEFLKDTKVPMSPQIMSAAIKKGPFALVKWLREHGCPFDESVFYTATIEARIDIMAWLKENGCPWDRRIVDHAYKSRDSAVVKYAQSINS